MAGEVIRAARSDGTGVATVAWRGASPSVQWAFMPEGFFRALGFEVVAEERDRVIAAVSYGAKGPLTFAPPPAAAGEGMEFLCHPSCPASMWAARDVAAESPDGGEPVAVAEIASREEAHRRGALFGVCRRGRAVVNRLAFKGDVEAVKRKGDNHSATA